MDDMDNRDIKKEEKCNCSEDCQCNECECQECNCCSDNQGGNNNCSDKSKCEGCQDCVKSSTGKDASINRESRQSNTSNSKDVNELQKNLDEVVLIAQKLRFENEKITTQLKKALADYANMQRDNDKRNEIVIKQLKAKSAMEIIGIIDEIELAYQAKEKMQIDQSVSAWLDGMIATMRKLHRSLETLGVVAMGCKDGDAFDSLRHEALGVVYEGKEGHIAQVMQDGYIMSGTDLIVRPARVIVSKSK